MADLAAVDRNKVDNFAGGVLLASHRGQEQGLLVDSGGQDGHHAQRHHPHLLPVPTV